MRGQSLAITPGGTHNRKQADYRRRAEIVKRISAGQAQHACQRGGTDKPAGQSQQPNGGQQREHTQQPRQRPHTTTAGRQVTQRKWGVGLRHADFLYEAA